MSSFVHDRRHIDAIVTIFKWLPIRSKQSQALGAFYRHPGDSEALLGQSLYDLNVHSVAAQYGKDWPEVAGEDYREPYAFRPVHRFDRPYNSDPLYIGNALCVLWGYRYQIEGTYTDLPAYHAVEQMISVLSHLIPGAGDGATYFSMSEGSAQVMSDLPKLVRLIG